MSKFLQQNRELFALVGMLFAVLVLMSVLNPDRFLTPGNLRSMAFQLPEIGLFTLGMMTVMLHGGINLAIIGTANITGIITALVVHAVQPEGGEWPAIVTGVLAGFGMSLCIGLANGIIVGYIGISSILTTLGMMTLVNGTCILITGGSTISRLPAPLLLIGNHKPLSMEYSELVSAVLEENRQVLSAVDPKAVDQLIDEILKAKAVHLYAMGRMQLSVRAFAMRLTHMGIPTYIVHDTTSPRIRPGDLLIGHCAVTNVELNVVRLAKDAGARIALLTAHPENEHGQLADLSVRVPGQIFGGPHEVKSIQPMASLLEQALFLFTDIVVMLLIERKGVSIQAMQENHTNLEGLPHAFA